MPKLRGQGATLDRGECLELIPAAEAKLREAQEGQRYADKHGHEEDYDVPFYQGLVDKLKKGAGE